MEKKAVSGLMLILLSTGILTLAFSTQLATASGTIFITANGSVDPPTAPIERDGDIYTLTDNIHESIVIQRNNMTLNGAGYTVQGTGRGTGINLSSRSNVTIQNMGIKGFRDGIRLEDSSNTNITGNNITNNNDGLRLSRSSNNRVSGNNITANNGHGIWLDISSNDTLWGNTMADNKYNFWVTGHDPPEFLHQIDASNTIEDKPLYYWVSEHSKEVPSDAGCFVAVNSTNITVKNLNVTKNGWDVALFFCTNSTVESVSATHSVHGIQIHHSKNIRVNNCTSSENDVGIYIHSSGNVTVRNCRTANNVAGVSMETHSFEINIIQNTISNNSYGLEYSAASGIIKDNTISNNALGVEVFDASDVQIYHNNFNGNRQHVDFDPFFAPTHEDWDVEQEGNYWSNYSGPDANMDGIGDIPHVIAQVEGVVKKDHYPLMGMFYSFNTHLGYEVSVVSNSTIEAFHYFESNSTIKIRVSNSSATQTGAFSRICMPYALMVAPQDVMIEGGNIVFENYNLRDNGTHRWIYLGYQYPQPDTTPPVVSLISPEDKTYTTSSVPLTFTVNEPTSWIGYGLDGHANVTITGNTTLTALSTGTHVIIVYANDTARNTGASEIIYFIIRPEEPFPPTWIVAAILITVVVVATLLTYLTKIKRTMRKPDNSIPKSPLIIITPLLP